MADFETAVIAVSGGMDSTSLLLRLLAAGCRVQAISFDYGQKHRLEIDRLQANLAYWRNIGLAIDWQLVNLRDIGHLLRSALTTAEWDVPEGHYAEVNMKQTVVPNRNAIFASVLYGYALSVANERNETVGLSLAVHSGDHAIYPDCRPEFYDALWRAFEVGNWDSERVRLYLPYLNSDKLEILKDAQQSVAKLGLDFSTVFRNTCTSYQPDDAGRSSGLTGSDVERILAFHGLGVPDPLEYRWPWAEVVEKALALEQQFRKSAMN